MYAVGTTFATNLLGGYGTDSVWGEAPTGAGMPTGGV